jgi:hypothetical protein
MPSFHTKIFLSGRGLIVRLTNIPFPAAIHWPSGETAIE